jgi:hypothetical protein
MTSLESGDKVIRKVQAPQIAHGYAKELVVTLLPGALVEVRELRRQIPPVVLDLAALYVHQKCVEARIKPMKGRA